MSGAGIPVGNVRKFGAAEIAARCAREIAAFKTRRVVTVDPRGRVVVEPPSVSAEADSIGSFAGKCEADVLAALERWLGKRRAA